MQTSALLAGIGRSGVTMAASSAACPTGDAARFAFLLATPVILAAGVLKLPTLAGPAAARIHGPVILGAVVAGVAAHVSVRYLTRYFETRTRLRRLRFIAWWSASYASSGSPDPLDDRGRSGADHQGSGRPSRKKPPVGPSSDSSAAHTMLAAPSLTGRPPRPMSVFVHPGHAALTSTPSARNS